MFGHHKESQDALRPATRHVRTRAAKCTDVDGGICEYVLYWVNWTNFVDFKINTDIKNNTNISLSTILQLYSEIAVSLKPFAIGNMYMYTVLLRMADIVTSQNIDISSWNTLYNWCGLQIVSFVPATNCKDALYYVQYRRFLVVSRSCRLTRKCPALLSDAWWLPCWSELLLIAMWPCDWRRRCHNFTHLSIF